MIQREEGAGVQRAFEDVAASTPIPGPRVRSHLEAARRSVATGLVAVTIEPAALALDLAFHPLETHRADLLIAAGWSDDRGVAAAMNVITSDRYRRRLAGVGGYDLDGIGTRVA